MLAGIGLLFLPPCGAGTILTNPRGRSKRDLFVTHFLKRSCLDATLPTHLESGVLAMSRFGAIRRPQRAPVVEACAEIPR